MPPTPASLFLRCSEAAPLAFQGHCGCIHPQVPEFNRLHEHCPAGRSSSCLLYAPAVHRIPYYPPHLPIFSGNRHKNKIPGWPCESAQFSGVAHIPVLSLWSNTLDGILHLSVCFPWFQAEKLTSLLRRSLTRHHNCESNFLPNHDSALHSPPQDCAVL